MANINERLQQAIAAARAGNTDEARELVDGLVEENPDNPHALFLRGMLASSQEEQVEYLNRVLEIDPDHKAANRRLAQIAPAEADDATVLIIDDPEKIEEPEAVEDIGTVETVVGAGALFAAEDDLAEEPAEEQGEWGVAETVVTAAAVGAGIEALEDDTTIADVALSEDTVIEEDLVVEEAPYESGDDTVITGAGDQDEEIPEWLMAESRSEEELTAASSQDLWGDAPAEEVEEVPDWLAKAPSDDWADSDDQPAAAIAIAATDESDFDDSWVDEGSDQDTGVDQDVPAEEDATEDDATEDEATEDDMATEDEEDEEAVDEKVKKKSSTRGLEIALVFLIVIALLIVVLVLYVVLNLF
jgi:hypothetical protein